MSRLLCSVVSGMLLLVAPAGAQDARTALRAAAAALGTTEMSSIQYSGSGWVGAVGQNFAPTEDWPRFDLTRYTRTIDFATESSREDLVVVQGDNPVRGGGRQPIEGERRSTLLVRGEHAWNLNGETAVPAPQDAELRRLEIYLTPYGFVKGAMAGDATAVSRYEYDERVTVVSFIALGKYRVNGTITPDGLVRRVQTWLPNPVVGDLYYETVYTNYREIGGIQFPGRWHQHRDFDDAGEEPNVSEGDHAFGLESIGDVRVNVRGAALTVPDTVLTATVSPIRVETERLADGIWLMGGGSHNSVAVEFNDYVAVIEAPLDEARSLAVIDAVTQLVPDKPIRFIVNTHHHWDHLGGVRAYVHEGATVITHYDNLPYYREVLRARPWLLEPDRLSLYPLEEWSEGYVFESVREKYMLGDANRLVELHHVQALNHVDGMLMAYFPAEKIVVEADLYTPAAPGASGSTRPSASNRTFFDNLQRLKLDVETIVPIHGRPGSFAEFAAFIGNAR